MKTTDSGARRQRDARDGEVRLRAIIDHVADGIVIVGASGEVRFVNPAAASLFGREPEELLGQPFGFPVVSDERAEIDILQRSGRSVVAELRVVEMEWEGQPALLVSLRDITDRKAAEERERLLLAEQAARRQAESEERRARFLAEASTVLDSSLDHHVILTRLARLVVKPWVEIGAAGDGELPRLAEWCVIDVVEDGKVRRVAGAHHDPERQELLIEMRERFPPDWEQPYPGLQALRSGEPLLLPNVDDEQLRALTRSEEHAALLRRIGLGSVMALPLSARNSVLGAITLVCVDRPYTETDLALATDLAQRAALAVDNARLYHEAHEANRAKSDFLAVMSHELRTPLNAIMGYADLLEAEVSGPVTDTQRQHIRRIGDSSRHLLHIVEEILTFARMDAGREELHPEPVRLQEVLEEVASMVRPLAQRKGLAFRLEVPEEPVRLETDPGKVRQILLNLLSNAVKFTEQGEVRLSASADGEGHVVEVADTGVGIPREHLERIFEPFWQVEQSASRTSGGTGLGLSVAQRLATLLGGSVQVESRLGRGSSFRLTLPPRVPAGDGEER